MGSTIKQQIDDVEIDFDDFLKIHPEELIEEIFSYITQFEHRKQKLNAPEKAPRYAAVRDACSELMKVIVENCPECADRTTALQTVRLARMWANSSIAREETGK